MVGKPGRSTFFQRHENLLSPFSLGSAMSTLGLFFTAPNSTIGTDLYFSDGTAGGTVQRATLSITGEVSRLQSLGNGLLIYQSGTEVRVSSGVGGATTLSGQGSGVEVIRPGVAAFITGDEGLAITDGVTVSRPAGFGTVSRGGSFGSDSVLVRGSLVDQGDGSAVFSRVSTGAPPFYSLYLTADTAAFAPAVAPGQVGTWFAAPNIPSGNPLTSFQIAPAQFEALPTGKAAGGAIYPQGTFRSLARLDGDHVVVSFQPASDALVPASNVELYTASLAGVALLRDINPAGGSEPRELASLGRGRVAFTADDGGMTGREPWITDGTGAGTLALGDLRPGNAGSGSSGFTPLGNGRFVFGANDGTNGRELWISDGTAAGTGLLLDLLPGADSSNPQDFTNLFDGRVAFTAITAGGKQVVFTNGTVAGTVMVGANGATNLTAGNKSDTDSGRTVFGLSLPGTNLNDSRRGGAGNDTFFWSFGDDTLDGGAGRDSAGYDGQAWRGWSSAYTPVDGLTLSRPGERDLLIGMESIRFTDGRLVFDADDGVAQIFRLYQGAFGRAPDEVGFNVNIIALGNGTAPGLANAFLHSNEFAIRHGDTTANATFVQSMYRSAFNRDGETEGASLWTGFLDAGGARGDVMLGFSQSLEMRALTAARLSVGIWDVHELAVQVVKLYLAALDHPPDLAGFNASYRYLTTAPSIGQPGPSFKGLASSILASAEFNRQPAGDDSAFVTRIYQQALDRAPEPEGLAFYTGRLASGASRDDVLIWISESPEAAMVSQPVVMPADGHGIVFA